MDHRNTSAAARKEDPAGRTPYDLPLSANQIIKRIQANERSAVETIYRGDFGCQDLPWSCEAVGMVIGKKCQVVGTVRHTLVLIVLVVVGSGGGGGCETCLSVILAPNHCDRQSFCLL